MIPYDELVVALANWRARNGLPVLHAEHLVARTAAPRGATPPPAPGLSGAELAGFQGAARTMANAWTPAAPQRDSGELDASELDVFEEVADDHEIVEAIGEHDGGDSAMSFAAPILDEDEPEATAIGDAPRPITDLPFDAEIDVPVPAPLAPPPRGRRPPHRR